MTIIGTVTDLPNPQFGDSVSAEPNRTFNRRMGGRHTIYRTGRPFNWEYNWQYRLRRVKAEELVAFFAANVGQLVQITDYLGNVLVGCVILNPEAIINEVRDHTSDPDCDSIEVNVRFLYVNP